MGAAYPLLVVLFSLFAIGPTLGSGYWWGAHDARHSVYFLFEFNQAIQDGILWPRWAPDFAFGYGYPFFNIYGPLSSYVGEFFHLLGMDLVSAVKTAFALSIVFSGLAMYGFTRRLFGEQGALVAAVAYVYLPYHLVDIYVRAALAESWAMVWFPLVFWGLYECVVAPRPRAIALTAIAYAGLFLSHNGLAIQTTFLLMVWAVWWLVSLFGRRQGWRWQPQESWRVWLSRAGAAVAAAALGVGLGAIFILPWVAEYPLVNTEQWLAGYFSFTDHFVEWWQLLSPKWGYGVSIAGPDDDFPFQLGLVPLLFAAGGWLFALTDQTARNARAFFTAMLLLFVFLMLEPSRFLWESPLGFLLQPAQFPWRFLVFAGFALAVLAGLAAWRAPAWLSLLMAAIVVAGSYSYVDAEIIEPAEGPVGYAGLMRFQQSAGEMTGQSACVTLENIPEWSPLADVWVNGGEVTSRFAYGDFPAGNSVSQSNQEITEVLLEEPTTIRWLITYYPGWHVYRLPVEGDEILEELEIIPQEDTCHISVQAPAGHYRYMVRFEDTPVRVIGKVLSALSMVAVGMLFWWDRRAAGK